MDKKSSADPVPEGVERPLVYVQVAPEFSNTVSEDRLRALAESALGHEGAWGEASLVITDNEGIRGLNRDYLGKDVPTDVLSFPVQEKVGPDASGQFVEAPEGEGYLGDVVVSYPRAVAQAEEQGHSVAEELALLIVHGMLHLLGYDHAIPEERAVMWARQEEILALATSARD
jgi:probable rRNA maturation factor